MIHTPPPGALYTSRQVRLCRDSAPTSAGNGPLSLFFANALGVGTTNLSATATACVQGGIIGFQMQTPGRNFVALLPYTLDYSVWIDQVINGNGPDVWTRTVPTSTGAAPSGYYYAWSSTPPNNVTSGADGIHEVKLFPIVNNGIGNGSGNASIGSNNNDSLVLRLADNRDMLAYYGNNGNHTGWSNGNGSSSTTSTS